jgi:hypothetical protein
MAKIKLYGHRELDATVCPGDKLFAKKSSIIYSASQKLAQYGDDIVRYDNTIYYHNETTLHKIATLDILRNWGFLETNIRDINETEFISYILGADLDYFARNDTEAYIAVGGGLRKVKLNYLSSRWGMNFEELVYLPQLIAKRTQIGSISFLARNPSTGMVYYLPGNNYKHWVNKSVYLERGYVGSYQNVPNVSSLLLGRYTTRGGLSYTNGTHFKKVVEYDGDSTYQPGYYYHETTYLRRITTMDVFLNYGFSTKIDVRKIEKYEFDTYLKARIFG